MSFDNNFIDDLKIKVNIVDVIGKDVKLKRAGSCYKGLCPFHSEKTPSFVVYEDKQVYVCFGCGEKGDVISYVEKYYRLPFMDAVEKLCNDYGIRMPEKASTGPRVDYDKYYNINNAAARFFFSRLTGSPNNAYTYCKGRKLQDSTIRKFGLGYAPADGSSLCKHLISLGYDEKDIIKLGLGREGKGGIYDYFRDRLIFPIFNTSGKVIGFGGRALGDYKPKYLNSQESDIFLKKNNLFGLNFTKKSIQELDRVIVVEGYMDVISLYQSGVTNAVASLGTALTDNQARLITRYTDNVVLSYDSDAAGISAALRGIGVMKNAGAKVKVIRIDDGKDPDEYIKAHGREAFDKLVRNALPATDFRLDIMRRDYDLTDYIQVLDYIRAIVPVLRDLSPVEQDIYIKKLAEEFNISENAIALEVNTETLDKPRYKDRPAIRQAAADVDDNRNMRIELSLVLLSMYNTDYIDRIEKDGIVFRSAIGRKLFDIEKSMKDEADRGTRRLDIEDICRRLDPTDEAVLRKYAGMIKLGPDDEEFYNECKSNYLLNDLKLKQIELRNRLSVAEKMGNNDEVCELAKEIMEVSNSIDNIQDNSVNR